ncbi:MAG: DNA polymerase III subunit epsilon [Anaerolineae bacterium]|nr:DNA polymerase III subunit epsilon [Anaerolineae bacterium]
MNRSQFTYLLGLSGFFIFLTGIASGLAFFLWTTGNSPDQVLTSEAISGPKLWPFGILLLLLLFVAYLLHRAFKAYFFTVKSLAEEMTLILSANPTHRVKPEGPSEVKQLGQTINAFADRFQSLLADDEAKILKAKAQLEEERNRLAALVSELGEGVLVCNLEGQILLYNRRAKQLLSRKVEKQVNGNGSSSGFVGLGRSIFGLVDYDSITHALEDIGYHLEKETSRPVSNFVTSASNGQLIRARMVPVLDQQKEITGFVLTLEDITQQSEASTRRDILLQSLTEGTRASLANIRAAIETIEEYPEMDAERLGLFRKIIREEAEMLSEKLNETVSDHTADLRSNWQLDPILGSNLIWAVRRRFEEKLDITTHVEYKEEDLWLNVDSFAVVQALTAVMRQLKVDFGVVEASLRLKRTGRIAALDMLWTDVTVDSETLWAWQNEASISDGEGFPLPLKEVAERHGGEIWCQTDKETGQTYMRLLLPTTQPKPTWHVPVVQINSRPEYYDFDLFHQAGQKPEMDEQPLSELSYTIFDTETTGLNPSQGDEIISISAIRIVNNRLLRQEVFDQLIDPKRPISRASIDIHGISPDMIKGQPHIEQVLPQFCKFSEDTVLVAHNAAFDMRMLQIKEADLGIKFINPVLDTLLLAAVVHPNQQDQSIEAIAQRLGVNVFGRHTSLGDAIVTAEIFLKLLPLLAEQGITTLMQARAAAEKTYYARISY